MTFTAEPVPGAFTVAEDDPKWAVRAGWVMPHAGPFEPLPKSDGPLRPGSYPADAEAVGKLICDMRTAWRTIEAKKEIDRMTFHAHAQINAMYLHAIGAVQDFHLFTYRTYLG